jgi:gliding motility-associated-like protein
MKFVFLVLLICLSQPLFAQNLLKNPDFEAYTVCPPSIESYCTDWTRVQLFVDSNDNTPTYYFNTCNLDYLSPINNNVGYQIPHSGEAFVSVSISTIYQELDEPLLADRNYRIGFYANIPNNSGCALDGYSNMGAFATPDPIPHTYFETQSQLADFYAKIVNIEYSAVFANKQVVTDTSDWTLLSGCFKAKGDEKFITIGMTKFDFDYSCHSDVGFFVFYFLDDVFLELIPLPDSIIIDTSFCIENQVTVDLTPYLTDLDNKSVCTWNDGVVGLQRIFKAGGTYTAHVTQLCGDQAFRVSIDPLSCACEVFMPNIFSPNDDNINDIFKPIFTCENASIANYAFSVFDRWGGMIFQSTDPSIGWDGIYRNQYQHGVFGWQLTYDQVSQSATKGIVLGGDVLSIE